MFGRAVVAGNGEVHQCCKGTEVGFLFEHHDMGAGDDRALALVGIDAPREQFEQSRLAGAVAADEREAVAFADIDVEVLEQPAAALDEAEAFIGENGSSHDERRATDTFSLMQARSGQRPERVRSVCVTGRRS